MHRHIKEPFSAISHFIGFGLAIVGLVVLIQNARTDRELIGSIVYGVSLIVLYLASTLTHAVHCSPEMEERLERFDYAAIFFLICGTYTPVCLLMIKGPIGWVLLVAEWLLAIIGAWSVLTRRSILGNSHVVIYLVMGWMFIFAIGPIISALSSAHLQWLIAGALFYSVGTIFFIKEMPVMCKGFIKSHDIWHVFVLCGSSCHFMLINRFILS
jgi:hemolysin III